MQFCLKNLKTKLFLKGYDCNRPLWTERLTEAVMCSKREAKRLVRRLQCQSQRVEAVGLKSSENRSSGG